MASAATIEPPTHSPQVCDRVIVPATSAPAWMAASSETKASVPVPSTNQKCPRTSALLRFRDETGPISSLQITGVDSRQREGDADQCGHEDARDEESRFEQSCEPATRCGEVLPTLVVGREPLGVGQVEVVSESGGQVRQELVKQ